MPIIDMLLSSSYLSLVLVCKDNAAGVAETLGREARLSLPGSEGEGGQLVGTKNG
jgi:hypothetical protein